MTDPDSVVPENLSFPVILAEILAQSKHEIGSVIRPLATPRQARAKGGVPATSSPLPGPARPRLGGAEVQERRRGLHGAPDGAFAQFASELGRLVVSDRLSRRLAGKGVALAELFSGANLPPTPRLSAVVILT
jgi:hypothetical protein